MISVFSEATFCSIGKMELAESPENRFYGDLDAERGIQVGWSVSEVQAAFVTSPATM